MRATFSLFSSSAILLGALAPLTQAQRAQTASEPLIAETSSAERRATWADVDGDGLRDLYLILPGRPDMLLASQGDGSFEDVTLQAGLSGHAGSRAAAFGDADGDGDADLLLVARSGGLTLLRGRGDGFFEDVSLAAGMPRAGAFATVEWMDLDEDGLLDLWVEDALGTPTLLHNEGERFETIALPVPAAGKGAVMQPEALELQPGEAGEPLESADSGTRDDAVTPETSLIELFESPGALSETERTFILGRLLDLGFGPEANAPPDVLSAMADVFCAEGVLDQATGMDCINASSEPRIDTLYPLSSNLFVDTSGYVGMGTTSPSARLDVQGDGAFNGDVDMDALTATEMRATSNAIAVVAGDYTGVPPTKGFLGVQGQTDFDGISTADWLGFEIGTAGISTGATDTDNYGVMGHSNGVGVRGESSLAPTTDYAELGTPGTGIVASGATFAGEFLGDVDVTGDVTMGATLDVAGTLDSGPANGLSSDGTRAAVKGEHTFGLPTNGYLGVAGQTDHDGVSTADWSGLEIGVAGISTGATSTDNFGVIGHSNFVGVRGEHSSAPTTDFAELGQAGIGIEASGSNLAGLFNGDIEVTGDVQGDLTLPSGCIRVTSNAPDFALRVTSNDQQAPALLVEQVASPIIAEFKITNTPDSSVINVFEISAPVSPQVYDFIDVKTSGTGGGSVFRVNNFGTVFADGPYSGPADFAEMIAVSTGPSSVEPGDVVVIDPMNPRSVVCSSSARSTLVAGIYSTNPGFVGSERDWEEPDWTGEGEAPVLSRQDMAERYSEVPIAVVGIVPCKVSAENGPIRPGDLLVTSWTAGHAMRAEHPRAGSIVGKALGSLAEGTGEIRVLVTLQ